MSISVTRARGLAAALLVTLLLTATPASAAAPDPDGWVRDWQRVTVADARVVRGASGGATLSFTVSRPAADDAVVVGYATADGSAVAGIDYTAAGGQLTLAAGQTSATIDVPVASRTGAGDDLALSLTLSDPSGLVLFERDHATGWILNRVYRVENNPDGEYMCDGGFYSIVSRPEGGRAISCLGRVMTPLVSAPVVDPRAGVATFTITRPAAAGGDEPAGGYGSYFIAYTTVDGSARAGVDYTAVSGRAFLTTGQNRTSVSVPVDGAGSGSFSLQLTTDRPGTTVGAYDADRSAVVPVSATATVRPLAATVVATPRVGRALTGPAGADSWAWWRCDAAGACQPIPGAGGQTYVTTPLDLGFSLRVRASAADPAGGTQLSDTVASGPVRVATPPAPLIDAGPAAGAVLRSPAADFAFSGREADGGYECALDGAAFAACGATLSFTTLASGPHRLSVRQRTTDGLASAATTRAWTVAAAADGAAACDGTNFTTSVVSGRDAVACDDRGIRDWQRVTIADAAVTRSTNATTTLAFTVTRPQAGSPLFLRYRTIAGTAAAGSDFTAADDVLVLEADQTSGTIAVPVASAGGAGDDRTLRVALADEQGGVVEFARATATGTLRDRTTSTRIDGDVACDGGLYEIVVVGGMRTVRCLGGVNEHLRVTASDVTVDPRAGVATFELRRPTVGGPAGIAYATVDGSARAGVDYVATSGSLIMSGDQQVARVAVPLLDVPGADGSRDFTLHLTAATPVQTLSLTDGTATIRRFTPALGGLPRVGQPLSGAAPGAQTRQWQRCDAQGACWEVADATAAAFTPTAAELGSRLRVRATVAGDAGETLVAETPPTAPVRDLVAPPSLSGGPDEGATIEATSATFALAGKEDDASWECALDGAAFAACDASGGSVTVSGLAPGAHSFAVRQRTVDGLASPPAARGWTVAAPRTPDPGPSGPDRGGENPDRGGTPPGGDGERPPAGTPPATTRPGATRPAPALRVAGVRQQNRSVARAAAGVTNVVLHCSRRCALSAPLTISRRDARRLGLRSTTIGRARGSARGAGLVRLRVRLDAPAKARLLRIAAPLTVTAAVANPAGSAVRVSFGLRPAGRRGR